MIWVSYATLKDGYRYRLIERARKKRVRFFVSDYILDELERVLIIEFDLPFVLPAWPGGLSFDSRKESISRVPWAPLFPAIQTMTPSCKPLFLPSRIIWLP